MTYPKLRPVSAFPITHENEEYICLQDPHHYLESPVVISPETLSVIQFFDGKHSFGDIQEAYMRHYGILVYTEQLQQIVEQLDQCLLLESPRFFTHVEQLRREFAACAVRSSTHQGAAYPDEKGKICAQFDGYFHAQHGPGRVPQADQSSAGRSVNAVMAPHIDFNAGGPAYAWAYDALAASDAEIFVILGTSHVDMKNYFALTNKAFATPFGELQTHQGFVEKLADFVSYNPFEDELIHKTEHSIEFQVVFLQYLRERIRPRDKPISIVPILCGGLLHEAIAFNQPLDQALQLEESIRGLQQVLEQYDKVCMIASVDLSHVGLKYGHAEEPDAAQLAMVEQTDRTLLHAIQHTDHRQFITQLQHNRNATQVCGVAPIYTMLRLLDGATGTLLHYKQAEFGPGSYVSFASMVWEWR